MITIDGNCPGGWLCVSWQHLMDERIDAITLGATSVFVLGWLAIRLVRRKRRAGEVGE